MIVLSLAYWYWLSCVWLPWLVQGCWHCHGCCRVFTPKLHRDEQTLGADATSGWLKYLWTVTCSHVWTCIMPQCLHVLKVKINHEGMICGHAGVIVLLWIIHTLSWSWVEACNRPFWSAGTCTGKGETGKRTERASWSRNTNNLKLVTSLQ